MTQQQEGPKITIILADDHPPTRAGVRAALEDGGFAVTGEYGDAASAVTAVEGTPPDIALLDVSMPGDGVAAASRISAAHPDVCIVMLTVNADDETLFSALQAGASGYLLKDTDPDRLAHALRGVLAGEVAMPRHLMRRVLDRFQDRPNRRILRADGIPASLTQREAQILELMCEGKTTSEIARATFVSPGTIRSHIAAILRKLQVENRAEAVRLLSHVREQPGT